MNTFITPTWYTTDVAMFWENEIRLVRTFDRQYNDEFRNKPEGVQIGATVGVRIPQRFTVSEGDALVEQAILNQTVPITVNHFNHVGTGWSTSQQALEVEEVQERYSKPTGRALANKVDLVCGLEVYQSVYFAIGSPGVALNNNQVWLNGVAKLQNVGVPGPYCAVVDPRTQAAILGANIAQFNPQKQISEYFRSGLFGEEALGIDDWYYDPNIPTHTTGTFTTSTPLVDGALQTGSTLALKGLGTYAFNAGDTFTLGGVNTVNPVSYTDTGDPQQFVLTAPLSGTGTAVVSISPAIITSGQLQTVTASPANNAQVFFVGATAGAVNVTLAAQTSKQSFVMNRNAFAFVTVDLPDTLPGAKVGNMRDKDSGVALQYVEQYNIQTNRTPRRVNIMYGVAPILPYFALRAWS